MARAMGLWAQSKSLLSEIYRIPVEMGMSRAELVLSKACPFSAARFQSVTLGPEAEAGLFVLKLELSDDNTEHFKLLNGQYCVSKQ